MQHALSVSQSGNCQVGHHTSQSFTSFIISFSRANAACSRRYASLSPSARSNGTRCMRDQIFSRCSSLAEKTRWHLNQSSCPRFRPPQPTARTFDMIRLRHAAGSHGAPRSTLGATYHLTRFSSPTPGSVRTFALRKSAHLFSMFPIPTR